MYRLSFTKKLNLSSPTVPSEYQTHTLVQLFSISGYILRS
eukprot:UN15305